MSIKELSYASKASQEGWEMWQMLKSVQEIKPKVIVEIGCDGGGFLETLTKAFPKAEIVGIDISKRDELSGYSMIYADSNNPRTAEQLHQLLNGKQIDFLFIDGDHAYEPCKQDYMLYAPMVRLGGIIGFHDTNNRGIPGVEVDQFLKEMDTNYSFRTADFRLHAKSPGTRIIWK